jgi:hypothetical protein
MLRLLRNVYIGLGSISRLSGLVQPRQKKIRDKDKNNFIIIRGGGRGGLCRQSV